MAVWLIALTIGLPWAGALVIAAGEHRREGRVHALAGVFAVGASLSSLALLRYAGPAAVVRLPLGGIFGDVTFVPDGLGVSLAAIAATIGALAVIFSADYMRGESQVARYYALVLVFIGAMAGLVLTGSLLLLFLFWEMVALCSYALISFHNDDPRAVAGGIKALLITQVGGIGLLAAALVTYAALGTYDIDVLLRRAAVLSPAGLQTVAFGMIVAAAAKSAQVPFHTWLPDAMEAPTPVSALIHAATMVNAGVYLLARFAPALAPVPGWSTTVLAVGAVSALLGSLLALTANDLKRVLAYSTVGQLGYMVFAIGAGAIFAAQYHLLSHAVFKALLFLAAGAVIHSVGTRDLRAMGGLAGSMPFVRRAFAVGAAALVGLPVLNGFWSKELILDAGRGAEGLWVAVLVAAAVLTGGYAFRAYWLVFHGDRRGRAGEDAPAAMRAAMWPLLVGAVLGWLLAGPLARLLAATLPLHALDPATTGQIAREVLTAPATIAGVLATTAGLAAWWWRERFTLSPRVRAGLRFADHDFVFEWINAAMVGAVVRLAEWTRRLQTGHLNWNMVAVAATLVLVLAALLWGS